MSSDLDDRDKLLEHIQTQTYKYTLGIAESGVLGDETSICLGMREAIDGKALKEEEKFSTCSAYHDYYRGYRYMFQLKMRYFKKYDGILNKEEIVKAMNVGHKFYEFYDD